MIPSHWIPFRSLDDADIGDLLHNPSRWGRNHVRVEIVEIDRENKTWVLTTNQIDRIPRGRGSLELSAAFKNLYIEKQLTQYDPTQAGDKEDDI
jgi:hypothetical protein